MGPAGHTAIIVEKVKCIYCGWDWVGEKTTKPKKPNQTKKKNKNHRLWKFGGKYYISCQFTKCSLFGKLLFCLSFSFLYVFISLPSLVGFVGSKIFFGLEKDKNARNNSRESGSGSGHCRAGWERNLNSLTEGSRERY